MIEALILVCNIGCHVCDREYAIRQFIQMVPPSLCGQFIPGDGKKHDDWPIVNVGEVKKIECVKQNRESISNAPTPGRCTRPECEMFERLFVPRGMTPPPSNGMYLCQTPVQANDLWTDIQATEKLNVTMTENIWFGIAKKNECQFFSSSDLKPIDFTFDQFLLVDGNNIRGWANPFYYIRYMNKK